jgi:DNA-directed RNA polymerase subunit D
MKIEVIERVQNENIDLVRFVFEGISVELANAFRRIVLTEVPSIAITECLFVENDSVLFDEIIAHRLGLIPLTTDLRNYNLPDECSCGGQGCTLCQAQFMAEVHAETGDVVVHSNEIESLDPKIHPVNGNIIIAKLGKGTSLVFEAYAQLGKGSQHAKFQPVSSIGYKYYPDVVIDNSKFTDPEPGMVDAKVDVRDKCHAKCFVINESNGDLETVEDYWKNCSLCSACERYAPYQGVKVNSSTKNFIFTVEGTGALPLKEIFSKAIEIFLEKIDEYDEQLKKLKMPVIAAVD